jgi:lycopene epsilon-cyclase
MAAGAAAGKFLEYESGAPTVAAQTAYGIQAEVEGYADGYDPDSMLFMDFRRHHTGLWNSTAPRSVLWVGPLSLTQGMRNGARMLLQSGRRQSALEKHKMCVLCQASVNLCFRLQPGEHPNAGEGLWGTEAEVPSFLYAMPVDGGRRVFLEETCLVAKPALPFAVLKRRLERRLDAMGIKVWFVCRDDVHCRGKPHCSMVTTTCMSCFRNARY